MRPLNSLRSGARTGASYVGDKASRLNGFLLRNPLGAYVILVLAIVFALYRIEGSIDDINTEREQRKLVVAQQVENTCTDNNEQDSTLAKLVAVSVQGQTAGFGSGIDPTLLTPFDVQVLTSIAKVQELSQQDNDELEQVFAKTLADLRAKRDCEEIVAAYLKGEDPPEDALGKPQGGNQGKPEDEK